MQSTSVEMMNICDDLKWGRVSECTSNMCVPMCRRVQIFDKLELEIWLTVCAILNRVTYDTMGQVWLSDGSEYDGNNIYKYICVTMMICM